MKMYKKSDLELIDGMLVSESGDVVAVNPEVVRQANELETLYQKSKYVAIQPAATPAPSLDGFSRVSEHDTEHGFTAVTPTLDAKVEEAMKIMDEIDDANSAEQANNMLKEFTHLLKFTKSDNVINYGSGVHLEIFDMPAIGSILELTEEDVVKIVAFACGLAEQVEE